MVNDAPIVTLPFLGDIVVDEDDPDTVIDVFVAFTDVDIATNGDSLTYVRLENTNSSLVTATFEGTGTSGKLILDYLPDQNGSVSITVKATDGDGSVAQQTFEVTVNALPPPQTSSLISGDGSILDLDPFNEASVDGGATWQSAYIVAKVSSWVTIPGTQYVFCGPTNIDPCGVGISTLYRTTFTLPSGFSNPSIAVDVHADNAVIVYLNGEKIGQQPCHSTPSCPRGNFLDPPETFSTSLSSLFQVGLNVLSFDLWDAGGAAGLDYKATVTHD